MTNFEAGYLMAIEQIMNVLESDKKEALEQGLGSKTKYMEGYWEGLGSHAKLLVRYCNKIKEDADVHERYYNHTGNID